MYGLETDLKNFACSWVHPVEYYVDKVYELGFNSIRLPFSMEYVHGGDFQNMDRFFNAIKNKNISVLLDCHRIFNSGQGFEPNQNGYQYYLDGWVKIIDKYKDNPQVYGLSLFNEFQGTDPFYWNSVMKYVAVYIENLYPNRFEYIIGGTRWGGSLAGIDLEELPFHNRIRYSVHKYIFSGNSVPADWDYSFGNYPEKVIVEEFGWKGWEPDQVKWGWSMINYLKQKNTRDTYFWCLGISGDTGGIFYDNCEDIDNEKVKMLHNLWGFNS
jgi:hypothetical protein